MTVWSYKEQVAYLKETGVILYFHQLPFGALVKKEWIAAFRRDKPKSVKTSRSFRKLCCTENGVR